MITRSLQKAIENKLFSGKSIVILGARQVGKTTLLKQIVQSQTGNPIWINGDNPDDRALIDNILSKR